MSSLDLPGYLYAKSLVRNGEKAPEYSRRFIHPSLARYEAEIKRLQDSFEWSMDTDGRHAPVVACRKVEDGVLIIRLFDEGEDAFRRPHTIRVEGILTAAENLAVGLDCEGECVPCPEAATFAIADARRDAPCPAVDAHWRFQGDEASYSLVESGRRKPGSSDEWTDSGPARAGWWNAIVWLLGLSAMVLGAVYIFVLN